MRCLVGLAVALALVASPLSASAQADQESTEASLQVPASLAESEPEQPALELKLDDAGVRVAPGYPSRTPDGYTLEEAELRVKRARIGLGISPAVFLGGAVTLAANIMNGESVGLYVGGAVLYAGGLAGTIASGILLRRRKRDRDWLRRAHYRRPARVQWDLAQSRLAF